MSYKLEFKASAKKEWDKLDNSIRQQFKAKLAERLANPRIPTAKLHNMPDCYKIKLRQSGYRLIYQVEDERITIIVLAVGRRDKSEAYEKAKSRLA
ncbi:type II toxin-antitoxin system RelE/ParE family toxin [Pseudogulbenkiania sp. MAI-1]|uniref:type II toxin-antitoxin system RelE family toxin n=1 Tax=Pseudogulbenkiania sp. MAI-1 TaxID=990370 RepID=UPI00045E9F17|nr:type II toxin-antitoxin system RelE/ParE family toxin [Pseudogulbenkiania sp. MAI-1]